MIVEVIRKKEVIFLSLFLVSCSDSPTVTSDQIVERDGIHYTSFTEEPFTGLLLEFHDSNGQLFKKGSFKNGKPEGSYIEYDTFGNIQNKGEYVNGLKEGNWIEKKGYESGKGPYLKGQRHGCWEIIYSHRLSRTYYKESGCYIDGSKDGKWTHSNYGDSYWELGKGINLDDQSTSVTVE